ncbi:hypothetical protein, variant [Puccinia striiformis f. sp. tritici PST-78]|uniref:Anaphase-promoting complex subunit 3 n=1 Tax=Puccinia striiformis f. sp. tritici PST-78 TaxID=1165861 RepID=A0A0L0VHS4_9BASI|nr:hypothetical protein, variant [Puccinia striiformis f. sp. tritici PST-78]
MENSQPSNSLINLLVSIIIKQLKAELIQSALFFSERLHALIPSSELATWLLSLCLLRSGNHQATVHLLRNAPIFIPSKSIIPSASAQQQQHPKGKGKLLDHEDPFNLQPPQRNQPDHHHDQKGTQRPANLASTRCALVYSKACSLIDRPKEGLDIYLQAIEEFGLSSPDEVALLNSTSNSDQSTSSAYTHLASLSYKSHEYEKANRFYRKALEASSDGHLCWEAFEGLCQTISTEEELNPEEIFCSQDLDQFLPGYMDLDDQYILCTSNATTNQNGKQQASSVPIISNAPIKPKPPPLAPKDAFRILGNNGLYRHHKQMLIDNSFGESSRNSSFAVNSFDRPCYAPKPNQRAPQPTKSNIINGNQAKMEIPSTPHLNRGSPLPPRSFNFAIGDPGRHRPGDPVVPISSTPNVRHGYEHNHLASANPPPPMPAPSPLPFNNPYTNRTPADLASPLPAMNQQGGGRGLIEGNSNPSLQPAKNLTTTTTATTTAAATATQTPAQMTNGRVLPRKEVFENGSLLKVAGPRETKRVKSDCNLIDNPDRPPSTPTIPSSLPFPPSTSSFNPPPPLPSSPSAAPIIQPGPTSSSSSSKYRKEKLDSILWVKHVLLHFATAYFALSRFKSDIVLENLNNLPNDQKKSWRAYCLIGKARFEMLDYKSAEIAFRKARESFPHLVTHMDIYSTLLWHLRKTTDLSYLSQELQMIDPLAWETWIATGNLFSRMDDHPKALKCFQRATQLSKTESYPYTLSGHESLMLSEYSRSLVFFRESIRRNSRNNYNAYFGLGEVFFKQDRFRLALFFFNHARQINPSNPLILAGVAKVYQANFDLHNALDVFNQAIRIGHNWVASVRFSRAKILFELGQLDEAKEDLIKLIDLVPTEFNVRFLLGKIYSKLNDKKLAIKHLTFAMDLEPKAMGLIKKILNELSDSS